MKGDDAQTKWLRGVVNIEEFFDTKNPSMGVESFKFGWFKFHWTKNSDLSRQKNRGIEWWRLIEKCRGTTRSALHLGTEILQSRIDNGHILLDCLMHDHGVAIKLFFNSFNGS